MTSQHPEHDHTHDPSDPTPLDPHPADDELPYSTWDVATHGPDPVPDWVVTELAARDADLGVLKTGKEADVHLVRRALPGTDGCLLAAKRYRPAERRMFHRDAGYQEGRKVRRSRDTRALAKRTEYGRELGAGTWAAAEFAALSRLWSIGAPVPYPVQLSGTELMLEFIGEADGTAAPRLAQCRPAPDELRDLFTQLVDAMTMLARDGLAHGDLSPYNLLLHRGELVLIDVPQIVDLFANPQGPAYLERDCLNTCSWFERRGFAVDPQELFGELMAEAAGSW